MASSGVVAVQPTEGGQLRFPFAVPILADQKGLALERGVQAATELGHRSSCPVLVREPVRLARVLQDRDTVLFSRSFAGHLDESYVVLAEQPEDVPQARDIASDA